MSGQELTQALRDSLAACDFTFADYEAAADTLKRAGHHLRMQFEIDRPLAVLKALIDAQELLHIQRIETFNTALRVFEIDLPPITRQELREAFAEAVQA